MTATYDPLAAGPHAVRTRTVELRDAARALTLPCELWTPDPAENRLPLVVFSHGSAAGGRRMATYLCTHLASHGYAVIAPDHYELTAADLAPRADDTPQTRAGRAQAIVANRPQDVAYVLDHALAGAIEGLAVDAARIALVGYSFGGWTVLASALDPRVHAVVAIAPAGSSTPKPGIAAVPFDAAWQRDVPVLLLTGDADIMTPLAGVIEIYGKLHAPKRLFVLRAADHCHFLDDGARAHEAMRAVPWPPSLAWIPGELQPIDALCPVASAHGFARSLALAHCDVTLRGDARAAAFLDTAVAHLEARGIHAYAGGTSASR